MNEQPLDFRRVLQLVRRYLTVVGIMAALGLLLGTGYTELNRPLHASNALVVLPSSTHSNTTSTDTAIAGSDPVLVKALPSIHPAVSLDTLRDRVEVTGLTPNVISITAQGESVAQAESAANAIAQSYVAYAASPNAPNGQVFAQVLLRATNATTTRLTVRLIVTAALGALVGALIGATVAVAIGRGDRRLRERDEIADAIGIPVLASVPVRHPTDAGRWAKLIEDYEPGTADAWRLRNALNDLDLAELMSSHTSDSSSLTVLSLASDQRALALGPQLAAFTASLGIPTALLIGPEPGTSTAALHGAATPPSSRRSGLLRLAAADSDDLDQYDARLTVVVAVVDGQNPQVDYLARTSVLVLGVSSGGATAEQLARVAACLAADGRRIAGTLVGGPSPADPTTGRLPQLGRPAQRKMPTRLTGTLR